MINQFFKLIYFQFKIITIYLFLIQEIQLKERIHEWIRANIQNGESFLRKKLRQQQMEIELQQNIQK
jgi:hypothetical protein